MESGDYARRVSNGNDPSAKMHENTPMIGDHRRNATARKNVNVTDRSADVDKGKKGQPGKKFFSVRRIFLFVQVSFASTKGTKGSSERGGPAPQSKSGVLLPHGRMW